MAKEKESGERKLGALQPREAYRDLGRFDELDRLMGSFIRGRWPRLFSEDWFPWPESRMRFEQPMPKVDVVDKDDEVQVTAELPGVKKEELDVAISDNRLTIRGSTSHEEKEEKGEYYRREIRKGAFSRTVVLPADVDGDQAKASFEDGVLKISLPKLEKAKRLSIKVE